jgi:hypothetical protein
VSPEPGGGFAVDPEKLAAHAAEFAGLADRACAISAALHRALAEAGTPWGTDAVGQSFAAAHTGPATAALEGLGALPDGLGAIGAGFAAAAGSYRAVDTGVADGLGVSPWTGDR